jgi:hypothetical protein
LGALSAPSLPPRRRQYWKVDIQQPERDVKAEW